MYGTYIGNGKMLITPKWGMRLYAPSDDASLMPTLLVDGLIESGLTNWLIKQQRENNLFYGKKVIDVGANIGYFTVLLGCLVGEGGEVVAYEANPRLMHNYLKETVYLGQLQDKVKLVEKAVSDSHGTVTFHASTKYQGNSSLKAHTDSYKDQFATDAIVEYDVQTEPLDSHLDGREIELIKIDVEGAELLVFKGTTGLLNNKKVRHVVFELNKNMMAEDIDEFYSLLKDYNSKGALFYTFTPDGNTVFANLDELFNNNYIDNILMKLF